MTQQIIRAIPRWAGQTEMFYDVTKLTTEQRREFEAELGEQHNYVQHVLLADPMPIMIGVRLRQEMEKEQAKNV